MGRLSELFANGFGSPGWLSGSAFDVEVSERGDDFVAEASQGPNGRLFRLGDFTFQVPKGKPTSGGQTARAMLVVRAKGRRDASGALLPTGVLEVDVAQLEIEVATHQIVGASLKKEPYRHLQRLKDKTDQDVPVKFRGPGLRLTIDVRKPLGNLLDPLAVSDGPILSIQPIAGALQTATVLNNVPVFSADPPHFMRNDGAIGATCGTVRLFLGTEGPDGADDSFRGLVFDQFGVYLNNGGTPDTWSGLLQMQNFRLALAPARVSGRFWAEILHHTRFNPALQITGAYKTSPTAVERPTTPAVMSGSTLATTVDPPDEPHEYLLVRLVAKPNWRTPSGQVDQPKTTLFNRPGAYRVRWTLPPEALSEERGRLTDADLGWVRLPPGGHIFKVEAYDARFEDDSSQGWVSQTITLNVPGRLSTTRVMLEAQREGSSAWHRLHVGLRAGETLRLGARILGSETNALMATLTCEPGLGGGALPLPATAANPTIVSVPTTTQPRSMVSWTITVPDVLAGLAPQGALVVTVEPVAGSPGSGTVVRRLRYSLTPAVATSQPSLRLDPEDDWVEAGGLARVGVRLTNGLQPEDVAWTLERVDTTLALLSSAAEDRRFRAGSNDGFDPLDREEPIYGWSDGGIGAFLDSPDRLWRLTASIPNSATPRPRAAIVVGESPGSLRLGLGGANLPQRSGATAWAALYGEPANILDDSFILFPRNVDSLGSGGRGEVWTPVDGIRNNRNDEQQTLAIQARGLADLLHALYETAEEIDTIQVLGCASSEGDKDHNLALSTDRAVALGRFIDDAITNGPSSAMRTVMGATAALPLLPRDGDFRLRCRRLASVKNAEHGLGTFASFVSDAVIDTNDRRAFVVLHLRDKAVSALSANCYLTSLDGAPARATTSIPAPISPGTHPLRHHWVRKARLEVELKENKLVAGLVHVLLDTSRINQPGAPPPEVDDLGTVDMNRALIGFTLAYSETPPSTTGGSPLFQLIGDVYSPPEDKDGLKAFEPAAGQRFLDAPMAALGGAAIAVPATIALAKNRANAFLGLAAALAGALLTRTSPTPGQSVLNPTRLVLRGFRLAGGWERADWSFIDVGVSYEVSYTVNVDITRMLNLPANIANPIKITTDPDRAPGKPMTLRMRNVMLRIFPRQVPEFRYNPDLGFALDVPDPGLLSIDGLDGPSAVLAKFIAVTDFKIEFNSPMTFAATVDFKFDSGFIKIGGLTVKGSFDPELLFSEGLKKSIHFDLLPTAQKITLSAEVKNVLKGEGSLRLGHPIGGDLDLTLEALKLRLYASIGVWTLSDFTAVVANAGFELSPGFPLWATGLGLQGIEALVGVNVQRSDQDPLNLLQWYAASPVGVGAVDKWQPLRGGFAFGAGVKIGTLADKGFSWWIKGMLVVQVPGPQIFLAARCGFFTPVRSQPTVRERAEGGVLAIVLVDLARNLFLASVDVTLEQKKVFKFSAPVRIMFNLSDAADFYIRFGQIAPAGGRLIEMEAFEYFRAWAYLQIEGKGFRTTRRGFPPLVLNGLCVAMGMRTEISVGAAPILWFRASLELHLGLQTRPFYVEGSALAEGEAGALGIALQAAATVYVRAGNDPASNAELLYIFAEISFTIRLLLWTPPPFKIKLEVGRRDAVLPPAIPLVGFAVLPRFQDKALDDLNLVPLDARLRLQFDKTVDATMLPAVRAGQVDLMNAVSDEISYRFALADLRLRDTASGSEVTGSALFASFPLALNPGEPALTLQLLSPDPAGLLYQDAPALSQAQRDTITEQLRGVCAPVPPAAMRSAVCDGLPLGVAECWTLSGIDLRVVDIETFTTALVGAGWVNQQGGQLGSLAAIMARPAVDYTGRAAASHALKLPKGDAGHPPIDIAKLGRRINATVKRGSKGQVVGLYRDADIPWTQEALSGWALISTSITESIFNLEGPSGNPARGASRLSRAVLITFPPLVTGRAVLLVKKAITGGGALWLDASGQVISDAALAFSGPLESALVLGGSASAAGIFAEHEARAVALSSTTARPAVALLLLGQNDADVFFTELGGVTLMDAQARNATLAQQRATIDELTARQTGVYVDPLRQPHRPLLKPATDYEVTGTIAWERLRNGVSDETGTWPLSAAGVTLQFRTVATPPRDLAPYIHAVDPPDERLPLYFGETVRIICRTDTLDEIFKRHNQRLVVRAKPSRAARALIAAKANVTTRSFEAQTPAEQQVADAIRSAPCLSGLNAAAPRDVMSLTGLQPDTPYELQIVALGLSARLDDAAINAIVLDPARGSLWASRLRTSRWRSFAEHMAAFEALISSGVVLDMVVDAAPTATATGPPMRDDAALETQTRSLFGGPLDISKVCEITRLWTREASGALMFCGLLLDSPEPLLRRFGQDDQTSLLPPQPCLTGSSGARVLLADPPVSNGRAAITFSYLRETGQAAQTRTLSVPIPSQPY